MCFAQVNNCVFGLMIHSLTEFINDNNYKRKGKFCFYSHDLLCATEAIQMANTEMLSAEGAKQKFFCLFSSTLMDW